MSTLSAELTKLALLGSERTAVRLPAASGAAGELLARLDGLEAEPRLLAAAAITGVCERAGRQPLPAPAAPAPACPDEVLAPCPETVTAAFLGMVRGHRAEVLPEALELLARGRYVLPPIVLPELLDLGQSKRELRDCLRPVLGRRGEWLAAQNPDWAYVTASAAPRHEVDWQTAAREERLAWLRHLREIDPARARELLSATWDQEPPEDRAAFLEHFQTGVNRADEPLLERALDDRRKEVRRVAIDLLAGLADSALSQRQSARALALLRYTPAVKPSLLRLSLGSPAKLEVVLPEACDKAMQRDGIEPKPRPVAGLGALGEKAWWLLQVVAATPPAHWRQTWDADPAALLAAAAASEWKDALFHGWAQAAIRHRDAGWVEAFATHQDWVIGKLEVAAGLFALLPEARREEQALALLGNGRDLSHDHAIWALLDALPTPLSLPLSEALVAALARARKETWWVGQVLRGLALKLAPDAADALAAWAAAGNGAGGPAPPALEEAAAIVHFRRALRHDLAAAPMPDTVR
jgi:hypothetical protein